MLKHCVLMVLCIALNGCLRSPHSGSEIAAIVIHNKTQIAVDFREGNPGNWGERLTIPPNQNIFFYNYERTPEEKSFPKDIKNFKFYLSDCTGIMNRRDIETYAKKPKNGRPGWDIFVDAELVMVVGCTLK